MPCATAKVPTIVAASIICLAIGVGAGIAGMYMFGFRFTPEKSEAKAATRGAPPGGMMPMGGGPGGMMPMGGGPGGMAGPGGGGRGPNSKAQLVTLVVKLDQLSQKPLAIQLDESKLQKVREQLKDLGDKEDISDDEAKQKLDAILELIKDHRETMEAAGYRWPGQRGGAGGGIGNQGNPMKDEKYIQHLKSLLGAKDPKA